MEKGTFISSVSPYPEEEYYLSKSAWSGSASDWDQRFEVGDVVADPSGSWEPSTAQAYIDQQVAMLNSGLAQESVARQGGDANLKTQLQSEMATRADQDANLNALINAGIREGGGVQFDTIPTQNSANGITSGGMYSTFRDSNIGFVDDTPTSESNNLVKSKGVYNSDKTIALERTGDYVLLPYSFDNLNAAVSLPASPFILTEDIQQKIRGVKICGIKANFVTVGTLSIIKIVNFEPSSSSPQDATVLKELSISKTGIYEIIFDSPIVLSSNEWIGVFLPSDTAQTKYTTSPSWKYKETFFYWKPTTQNFNCVPDYDLSIGFLGENYHNINEINDSVRSSVLFNNISKSPLVSNNIYYADSYTNLPASPFVFKEDIQKLLRNKPLWGIKINVQKPGKISLVKYTDFNVNTTVLDDVVVIKEIYPAVNGEQDIIFSSPLKIEDNEWLGIMHPNDTGNFVYDPTGGSFEGKTRFYYRRGTGEYTINETMDLCVGFLFENKGKFVGKKIAVIGDSISTYQGYLPSNISGYTGSTYDYYYPSGNVNSVVKTWWFKMMGMLGYDVTPDNVSNYINNCSWSGSTVGTWNNHVSDSQTDAFCGCSTRRITDLSVRGYNPDIIICFISCNDWGNHDALVGEWSFIDSIPSENSQTLQTLRGAYALMLNKIHVAYPNARIFCCTNLDDFSRDRTAGWPSNNRNNVTTADWNKNIVDIASAFGCEVIELHKCGINYSNIQNYAVDSGLHPNDDGHTLLAEKIAKTILEKY